MQKEELLNNITKISTTKLGIERIKRNLDLETENVILYCQNKIMESNCRILRKGKNWYCLVDNIIITINASSYTIITAHKQKESNNIA